MARQSEGDGAESEAGHRQQQDASGIALQRVPRQPHANHDRTQRRRAAQDAQAFGAVVQDVVDEGRQHRYRAAEQYRKHVQRHRAQHDLVGQYELRAFGDAAEDRRTWALADRLADTQQCQRQDRQHRHAGGDPVGQALAAPADQHTAQRRADHHAGLEGDAADAGTARECLARQRPCEQGVVDRRQERARRAGERDGGIDRPHAFDGQPALRDRQQQQRGRDQTQHGDHAQPAARQGIDQIAGEGGDAEERQDFGQADQPQRERVAGNFVDMPTDRHGDDLVGQHRRHAVEQHQAEAWMGKQRPQRIGGRRGGRAHCCARAVSRMKASIAATPLLRVGDRCLARPIPAM